VGADQAARGTRIGDQHLQFTWRPPISIRQWHTPEQLWRSLALYLPDDLLAPNVSAIATAPGMQSRYPEVQVCAYNQFSKEMAFSLIADYTG
jgi:hypothetical protein